MPKFPNQTRLEGYFTREVGPIDQEAEKA